MIEDDGKEIGLKTSSNPIENAHYRISGRLISCYKSPRGVRSRGWRFCPREVNLVCSFSLGDDGRSAGRGEVYVFYRHV